MDPLPKDSRPAFAVHLCPDSVGAIAAGTMVIVFLFSTSLSGYLCPIGPVQVVLLVIKRQRPVEGLGGGGNSLLLFPCPHTKA